MQSTTSRSGPTAAAASRPRAPCPSCSDSLSISESGNSAIGATSCSSCSFWKGAESAAFCACPIGNSATAASSHATIDLCRIFMFASLLLLLLFLLCPWLPARRQRLERNAHRALDFLPVLFRITRAQGLLD